MTARSKPAVDPDPRALRAELNRLVRAYARIWQLPPSAWGTVATTAHARAEALVALLEAD